MRAASVYGNFVIIASTCFPFKDYRTHFVVVRGIAVQRNIANETRVVAFINFNLGNLLPVICNKVPHFGIHSGIHFIYFVLAWFSIRTYVMPSNL